jgi:hypothetical protein
VRYTFPCLVLCCGIGLPGCSESGTSEKVRALEKENQELRARLEEALARAEKAEATAETLRPNARVVAGYRSDNESVVRVKDGKEADELWQMLDPFIDKGPEKKESDARESEKKERDRKEGEKKKGRTWHGRSGR